MVNGNPFKGTKLFEGMILVMEDGSQRKVVYFTAGAGGVVQVKTRRGNTGSFSKLAKIIKRRFFWEGVAAIKEQKASTPNL